MRIDRFPDVDVEALPANPSPPDLWQHRAAEPIGQDFARSNHAASLLLIQALLGWVSDSQELAKALANYKSQPAPDDRDAEVVRQKQPEHEKGIRGEEYNRFWVDTAPKQLAPWRRTSLVVDPPDGRIPAMTPEAIKRLDAREAARRGRQLFALRW